MNADSKVRFKATVDAEHRDGKGNLISRCVTIEAPDPPNCSKPKCLWKFFKDTVFCSLISTYHSKRVRYAEKNRRKKIPMKYRTGEEAPDTIIRVILAIIRLNLRR